MNKQQFLEELRSGLSGLSQQDIDDRLTFYNEMIDERIEDGISEQDALDEIGSVDDVVSQIIAQVPLSKLMKEKVRPRKKLKTWEIILLVLGAPIWLSLGLALIAVIISLYVSIWSVIISLWGVFASVLGCCVGGILSGIVISFNDLSGIAMIAVGIFCAGLSIFIFFGCKAATNGLLILTKKVALLIKMCFIKKGEI